MADTQRTRAALLALIADNVTGQISEQDLRDILVTVMQPEFVNANDFWNEPSVDNISTDLTTRGWHLYSQVAGDDMRISFGVVYDLTISNTWSTATASTLSQNTVLGIGADSYASAATTVQILRKGIVYWSALATRLTGNIGDPIYLQSATTGSYSITTDGWSRVIGHVLPAGVGSTITNGKFFFDPDWGVTGA